MGDGTPKTRSYSRKRDIVSSGNWYTKGRKARVRRVFKKGARQAGKADIAERVYDID